jgi:hypothetical protein
MEKIPANRWKQEPPTQDLTERGVQDIVLRDAGSIDNPKRRYSFKIRDFYTAKEAEELVNDIKERAKTSDKLVIFLAEHLFGKAPQVITDPDGNPVKLNITNILMKVYGQEQKNDGDTKQIES